MVAGEIEFEAVVTFRSPIIFGKDECRPKHDTNTFTLRNLWAADVISAFNALDEQWGISVQAMHVSVNLNDADSIFIRKIH